MFFDLFWFQKSQPEPTDSMQETNELLQFQLLKLCDNSTECFEHVIKKKTEKGQHHNAFASIAHGILTQKGFESFLTICVKQNNRGDDPKIIV